MIIIWLVFGKGILLNCQRSNNKQKNKLMETIAVHASEESTAVLRHVKVSSLSMAAQQLILNNNIWGIHEDPLGNLIAVDTEGNHYPA